MRTGRFLTAMILSLALLVGSVSVNAGETAPRAYVEEQLLTALATATGPVEVVVTFYGDGAPTAAQADLLRQVGIASALTLQSLPMAGVLANKAQVEALAANPAVRSLVLNAPLTYYNADATALTGVDKVRTDAAMTAQNGGFPVSGKGVTVVINDSGVDGTHKDHELGRKLKQNVMASTNLHALVTLAPITYVENVPNTDSNSGHGTHVAGTVGGTGAMSGAKYEGAAPGAALVGYGSGAALFVLDGIGGFDYAITHQFEYGIRVITNSWGSSGGFNPNHPINVASYSAYQRNMVVLFAAGNSGPGENTHNPYAKAPWVISVAAGDKQGRLAEFSSRGTKDHQESFSFDGRTWTWRDRPTVTAPGVDIISTRVIAPLSALATQDAAMIEPAYVPYYTVMSGTSMATPHVAGIVALMLEANPLLTPDQTKAILQETATNMPGMEPWEVGAGHVNAYAAVERAFGATGYGSTLNLSATFHAGVDATATRTNFTIDYNPFTTVSDNRHSFAVPAGVTELAARVDTWGLMKETGNTINLVLIAPDGTEYSSGISLLFALYGDRTVVVASPQAGTWHAELRGLRGDALNPTDGIALPERVPGLITLTSIGGFTGLNDIAGHPAAAAIKLAVSERLVDGYADGNFRPDTALSRRELARYLVMGAGVRQSRPGAASFSDVAGADLPFVAAVTARGAALKDRVQSARGVLLATGSFGPNQTVRRAELTYSLVQSLGLEVEAIARNDSPLTVQYGSDRIAIADADQVPAELRGYVQVALDLNILNAYFHLTQGPFDLTPVIHATFAPNQTVTRGEYAVAVSRFFATYLAP